MGTFEVVAQLCRAAQRIKCHQFPALVVNLMEESAAPALVTSLLTINRQKKKQLERRVASPAGGSATCTSRWCFIFIPSAQNFLLRRSQAGQSAASSCPLPARSSHGEALATVPRYCRRRLGRKEPPPEGRRSANNQWWTFWNSSLCSPSRERRGKHIRLSFLECRCCTGRILVVSMEKRIE